LKTLVFDCGDTLLTLSPSREDIFRDALLAVNISPTEPQIARAYQIVEYANRQMASELKHKGGKREYARRFNHTLADVLGLDSKKELIDELVYSAFENRRSWRPLPGAIETLQNLKKKAHLYVFANWDLSLEQTLQSAGLDGVFSQAVSSASLGAEKPTLEAFTRFAERTEIELTESVYVGNEYIADVKGSRRAGMTPLLLDVGGFYSPAVDCSYAANWGDAGATLSSLID